VWQETRFAFHDNDRWVARFRPDRVGRWRYTIEAWPDRFESWRADLVKKREAGQVVDLGFAEGASLVEAAVAQASKADAARLGKLTKELTGRDPERRAAIMLSPELQALMARADDRADRVRYGRELELVVERPEARVAAWYEMFPRSQGKAPGQSATFSDCIERLAVVAALDFEVVSFLSV